ncbi:NACHT domain-containing protein [Spirulina sp. 06S082]|uniref:NACHT C-terminal alpha/beta 1 domain-containing protein n=1 Tax=Spirulina sp. 06S082 TaxID=3110248 RepID=UPI002B209AA8|nr:NACHT domain-containing protein [Spirulina sp. 06S082]MEA5467274.1 NACHT domain-containing protein [Spirulina sp. 06S082]
MCKFPQASKNLRTSAVMVGKSGKFFKKSRNYGESTDDLQDRLDFVASLLALADEKIEISPDKELKAQFKLEWVKENELRVSGTVEQQKQRNGQRKPIEKGITKKDLGILLETYCNINISKKAREVTIQNALDCLRDLEILQEHPSAKNQGFWQFSLFLKHQTASRKENLDVIRDAWREKFGKLPQPKPEPTPNTLKCCILGLKGKFEKAQRKQAEITKNLQHRFRDRTLSIALEKGSIILIVESYQTGYEQLKGLVKDEIAGFEVEYAIAEWQNVCRNMLPQQTQLSSNSLFPPELNRNLFQDDLFIDLALVQPSRKPEKPEDAENAELGSQLYTRQAIEKRFEYREFLEEVKKSDRRQIAIIGEPGAGKTTLLQKLAFWLLQTTDDLAIWVSLGDVGEGGLNQYLDKIWLEQALKFAREGFKADWEQKFEQGAVWLLLDGLDEMSAKARESFSLQGWVTKSRCIVSCRLNVWQGNPVQLQGFKTYLTQPFQDEQMQGFIQRWFQRTPPKQNLWSALQTPGKESIKDSSRNPLRLTLLCAVWELREGNLPDTKAKLYQRFVDYIYEWKQKEFPVTDKEKKALNKSLGKLAKAALDGERTRFRLSDRLVHQYLSPSLFEKALQLGWLNEVGRDADEPEYPVYAFYHATFQEYFAALAVEDWDYFLPKEHCDRPVEGRRYRIFEKQWKQVILLWLGREDVEDEEKERFIQALVEFDDGCGEWNFKNVDRGFYEYQAYFLAAATINEFKTCSITTQIVRQILKWRLGYFNSEAKNFLDFISPIQNQAEKVIFEIQKLAILEIIEIAKNCSQRDILSRLTQILNGIGRGNSEAINGLLDILKNTDQKETRRWAALSLQQVGLENPQAISGLLKLLHTTDNEDILCHVDEIFRKIGRGNSQAISGLIKLLGTTDNEITRKWIAYSLQKIASGNSEAISGLSELLDNTEHENIFRWVVETLKTIDPKNPKVIPALLKIIQTTNSEETLIQTAMNLNESDPENLQSIAALCKVIETTNSEETKIRAAINLGKIDPGHPQAIRCSATNSASICFQAFGVEVMEYQAPIKTKDINSLVNFIKTAQDQLDLSWASQSLEKVLTTPKQYKEVVYALKDNLCDEVYQNNFDRFHECYKLIWNCAEKLPYPKFYRAWHNPPTTSHPEISDQTPHNSQTTLTPPNLPEALQNPPILILDAQTLTQETRESEIALKLCKLIWKPLQLKEIYPEVSTPGQLTRYLDRLQLSQQFSQRALLLTQCQHPTPELLTFCQQLTDTVAIAFLTEDPLDLPLKGFPPYQPRLISAIETWLEEM